MIVDFPNTGSISHPDSRCVVHASFLKNNEKEPFYLYQAEKHTDRTLSELLKEYDKALTYFHDEPKILSEKFNEDILYARLISFFKWATHQGYFGEELEEPFERCSVLDLVLSVQQGDVLPWSADSHRDVPKLVMRSSIRWTYPFDVLGFKGGYDFPDNN